MSNTTTAPTKQQQAAAKRAAARAAAEDPIAAAGAEDDVLDAAENETLAPPLDGGEVDHSLVIGGPGDQIVTDPDDDEDDDDFEDLPPQIQTTVNVRVRKGDRTGQRKIRLIHEAGCPAHTARVESYPARTPKGRSLIITRCIDCAAHVRTKV